MVLGMEATPLHRVPRVSSFKGLVPLSCVALFSPISGFRHHHHQVHFSSLRRGGKGVENKVYSEITCYLCSHSIGKTMATLAAREAGKCSCP